MTTIKRLVAVAMAFLMILGSLSMVAFAWDATIDDGFNLGISTKFFRNVKGEWVETTKVEQGEKIKARVYLSTDYYTNSGNLLFFYNSSFLQADMQAGDNTLVVNSYYAAAPYTITGKYLGEGSGSNVENALIRRNAISQDFADEHDFIHVRYYFDGTSYNQKFNGNKWFCEFELTVKEDAPAGEYGRFLAFENTAASPEYTDGYIQVPKGTYDTYVEDVTYMHLWNANLIFDNAPVEIYQNLVSATFNVNDGEFLDGSKTMYVEGEAGVITDKLNQGYKFSDYEAKLISAFSLLNHDGQAKAIERVEELAEIPKYQNKHIE